MTYRPPAARPMWPLPVLSTVLALLGIGVLGGFPAAVAMQLRAHDAPLSWSVIAGCAIVGVLLVALAAWSAPPLLRRFARRVPSDALLAPLLVGLALRAALLALDPKPTSDGASYLALAAQLAAGEGYGSEGGRAFWPPGLPLLIAPLQALGLPQPMLLLTFGAGCLIASLTGLRALMRRLDLGSQAGLAMWTLALWPTHALLSTLPEKELLVLALLLWIVERTLAAWANCGVWPMLFVGLLVGAMVLVQPSLQLLPGAAIVAALWFVRRPATVMRAGALVLLGATLVVAPWTTRNLRVLGHPVLVSTNGGDVLYRANNELATGVYTAVGHKDLRHLDELGLDRESRRLAWRWIAAHPDEFIQLAAAKFLLFLGDDSYGTYAVFSRGGVDLGRPVYLVVKVLGALPWLSVWFAIAGWCASQTARGAVVVTPPWSPRLALVVLPIVYLTAIHSVFESGPKYHVPLTGLTLVIFGAVLAQARGSETGAGVPGS